MKRELVIVIDFGGQYNQLVARRVRECNVYCEIYSYKTDLEKIKEMNPKGIILTGGPNSCYEEGAPTCSKELFEMGIPVLGLCYGAQLMMHVLGGKVEKAEVSEYGKTEVLVDKTESQLFKDVSEKTICWMSHTDYISQIAPGFEISAHTADCPVATAENADKNLYAIQFHPEVLHTAEGTKMLSNFVLGVCGCAGDWKMDAFVENTIKEIREKVGDGKVLLALSGGVDSSVAAGLLSRAIGKQLTCVFVDHGLLRKDEGDEVEGVFGPNGQFDLNFIRVNAQQRYYDKLAGVTEPTLYGICVRMKKPLIATWIACIVNAIFCAIFSVRVYSFGAPSFFTMPIFLNPDGTMSNFYFAIAAAAITIVVSFVSTWVLGFDDSIYGEEAA